MAQLTHNLKGSGVFDKHGNEIDIARAYLMCKMSPLFFIENFVIIEVAGGKIPIKESDLWYSTPKYRQLIRGLQEFDAVSFMASRQHGKTQTVAEYLLWAIIFHPGLLIEYVTLDSKRATDFIKRIKFMLKELPDWLRVDFKGKSEKVTFIELENGARINSNYVSGSIDPDRLGRGMSAPIIYIDETAFIPKMDIVWVAMQPAISAASRFAKKNGYPNGIIYTTTPNGAGVNFFYNVWTRGWDSSELFEGDSIKIREDWRDVLDSDDNKNNFVRFKIHWSETNKDEKWYKQQIKELNFNMRKVSQELDLVFLGSNNAVFDDSILEVFTPKTVKSELTLAYGEKFNLFEDLDPEKKYLLGVDTAASTAAKSDYSAMVLVEAETGLQVGEWHGKFSIVKRFALMVKSTIRGLHDIHGLTDDSLTVIIERNSFGLGVVEDILYSDEDFDYPGYMYWTQLKHDKVPGMQTDAKRREKMFNLLLSIINENPKLAQGVLLQEELRNLEQKPNGRFEATTGAHDDVVLSYNFCLFVRDEMIKDGLITLDGSFNKLNAERINYYLDVSMNSVDLLKDRRKNKEELEIIIIDNDHEERRQEMDQFDFCNNIIML